MLVSILCAIMAAVVSISYVGAQGSIIAGAIIMAILINAVALHAMFVNDIVGEG